MIDLSEYYPFKLTGEQKELINRILKFIDSHKKVFIIKGYAGTGKTSIMLGLVKYLGEIKRPFHLMASTGRASKVLAEKSKFPASTVHSTIYAVSVSEIKSSNGKEKEYRVSLKLKMPNYNPDTLFFIDESSMLTNVFNNTTIMAFGSGYLLNDLFSFVNNGKIIFIGDPAQLPPVNSKFSAALNHIFIKETFGADTEIFELKNIMRYKKNSGIYHNTQRLREIIKENYYPPLSIKAHGFDDIKVYYHENDMVKSYYEHIKTLGVDSVIYITLSNKIAGLVNKKVRYLLWGHNGNVPLKNNESLMVVRNNHLYGLNNGDLITVDKIESNTEVLAGLNFRHIHIRVLDPDPKKGYIIKRVLIIEDLLSTETRDLSMEQDQRLLRNFFSRVTKIANEVFELLMQNTLSESPKNNTFEIKRNEKLQRYFIKDHFIVNIDKIIENRLSKKKVINQLIRDNMMSDPYLNALRVKYGYAVTCHKAQGSEWQHVFVHLEKSLFYLDKENQHRWTYTALSRAEQKLHLLNNMCIY